jgi:hypothetical protein
MRQFRPFVALGHITYTALFIFLISTPTVFSDEWVDFAPTKDPLHNTEVDLRSLLNEDEAGAGGFIQAKGSQFIQSGSGRVIRFWGVNGDRIADGSLEEAKVRAHWLAKRGVNANRWHGPLFFAKKKELNNAAENANLGDVDPAKLDRAFKFVAANKSAGIYSHFSIYFQHWFEPDQTYTALDGYNGKMRPFAVHFYDPEHIAQFKVWWKALLTTKNPYTGMTLAEDPSVMGVELLNEDSFFFWTFKEDNLTPPQLRQLQKLFGDWASKKYGSISATLSAWNSQSVKSDETDEGLLGFRPLWNIINDSTQRDKDTTEFLAHVQRDYYAEMTRYIKQDLSFKAMVTASNWHTADAAKFEPIERWSYSPGDFMDNHGYFSTWREGEHVAWSMRPGHRYVHRAATKLQQRDSRKNGIKPNLEFLFPEWQGMPTTVSEITWTRPNRYRTEAPLFIAAYGSLHDVDGYFNFALDGTDWSVKPRFWMQQWTLAAPTQIGQFPAAALLYRRAMVATGEVVVSINTTAKKMFNLSSVPLPKSESTDMLRLADTPVGADLSISEGFDPSLFLVGRVIANVRDHDQKSTLKNVSQYIDHQQKIIRSSTDELKLDYGLGLFTVDAKQAQAVVGDVKSAGIVKLSQLTVTSPLDLINVMAISLDDKAISDSKRILVQVMSEEQNTGWQTNQRDGIIHVQNLGHNPWQIKALSGTISLKGDIGTVTALDYNLMKGDEVGKSNQFDLLPGTIYYLIQR